MHLLTEYRLFHEDFIYYLIMQHKLHTEKQTCCSKTTMTNFLSCSNTLRYMQEIIIQLITLRQLKCSCLSNFHHQPGDFFRTGLLWHSTAADGLLQGSDCTVPTFVVFAPPPPSRCLLVPQGGYCTDGTDGISPHLCSSLVVSWCILLLWCLVPDRPFLFLLSLHSPSLWRDFPSLSGLWGLSPTFHSVTVFFCLLYILLLY